LIRLYSVPTWSRSLSTTCPSAASGRPGGEPSRKLRSRSLAHSRATSPPSRSTSPTRAPASPHRRSWWPWRSGSELWICPSHPLPNGSGSTGSSRGRSRPAKRSMRAGRSPRSGPRWAARPQPSWSGGWTCTRTTGRCVRKERWGPACGARRRPPGLAPPKPCRPGRRQHLLHRRGGAAVAARLPPPRRPLPLHHQSKLRPPWPLRPQGPPKRLAPPGEGAGAARGQALRQVATVSRRRRLRLQRPRPRPCRRCP
jgi:hypothetical protein